MLKIARNDTVLVRSGKDRGKKGKVLQILPEERLVVVEGVNKIVRHIKPRRRGEHGQKIELNGPVQLANVSLICPNCSKPARVGFLLQGTGRDAKKVRLCKKCKKPLQVKKEETKK